MRKTFLLAVVALGLVAGPALASNTGFKLNYPLNAGVNLMSFPYFYFPDGDVSNPDQTSLNVCEDMITNDCPTPTSARAVIELRGTTPFRFGCNLPAAAAFPIVPGTAYFVETNAACTFDIVGSHDDRYSVGGSLSLDYAPGTLAPISVPYHVVAENSFQLCQDVIAESGGTTAQLAFIELRGSTPFRYGCNLPEAAAFPMDPGEGYFIEVGTGVPDPYQVRWNTY